MLAGWPRDFFNLFGKGPLGLLLWEIFGILTEIGKFSSFIFIVFS